MKVQNPIDGSSEIVYTRETDAAEKLTPEERVSFMSFFSPKTVEEQYVQLKITPEVIKEVEEFLPYITRQDVSDIVNCRDSKECLFAIARVISRIRSEETIFRIDGVDTFSVQVMDATRGAFQEILPQPAKDG